MAQGTGAKSVVARASAATTPPAADVTLTPKDYLAAAARLTIRFRGHQELSGDYRVGPDQTISIPVIGRMSLAGMDVASLEKELIQRTSTVTSKGAYVTVEIAAYQPVFVTGAVKNPGAIEWQPNMTVLQAITLAGGRAIEAMMLPGQSGPVYSRQLILKSVDGQKRDLAALARLKAARDGDAAIKMPRQLVDLVGMGEAKRLIADETTILASDREALAAKLKILRQGIASETDQIASLRSQMGHIRRQLDTRKAYLEQMNALRAKGILTNERLMEQEIKVSDLQEKIANIDVGIAKSSSSLANFQLAEVALERDRHRAVIEEIAKIERQSAHLGIDLEAFRTVPEEKPQDMAADENGPMYQIIRRPGGTPMEAQQGSQMRHGDVLMVSRH